MEPCGVKTNQETTVKNKTHTYTYIFIWMVTWFVSLSLSDLPLRVLFIAHVPLLALYLQIALQPHIDNSMCVHKATRSTNQSWLFPAQTSIATLSPHYYVITIKACHCVTKKYFCHHSATQNRSVPEPWPKGDPENVGKENLCLMFCQSDGKMMLLVFRFYLLII